MLYKIFNQNTLKLSHSCTKKIGCIGKKHKKDTLRTKIIEVINHCGINYCDFKVVKSWCCDMNYCGFYAFFKFCGINYCVWLCLNGMFCYNLPCQGIILACFVFWHLLKYFAIFFIAIYDGKLHFATQIIATLGKNLQQ